MASPTKASTEMAAELSFGVWLRQVREKKEVPQRAVAAAAQMDSSHYGKVESGKRFLTDAQVVAVAEALGQTEGEVRRQMIVAQWARTCRGDVNLMADVAGMVHETTAPRLVNKSANNRAKKK